MEKHLGLFLYGKRKANKKGKDIKFNLRERESDTYYREGLPYQLWLDFCYIEKNGKKYWLLDNFNNMVFHARTFKDPYKRGYCSNKNCFYNKQPVLIKEKI